MPAKTVWWVLITGSFFMVTHKQLRIMMLFLLLVVVGMAFSADFWLDKANNPFLALAYWGVCALLIMVLIALAFADIQILRATYLRGKSRLLKETMTDEEFTRKLRKKKLKVVLQKTGSVDAPEMKDEKNAERPSEENNGPES